MLSFSLGLIQAYLAAAATRWGGGAALCTATGPLRPCGGIAGHGHPRRAEPALQHATAGRGGCSVPKLSEAAPLAMFASGDAAMGNSAPLWWSAPGLPHHAGLAREIDALVELKGA